ncbi:MAG: hypothetical protein R8J94_11325 [Acidimicrobiia bacterium]|nr:hypothetical protein [Acidimicrobiia bacterium]
MSAAEPKHLDQQDATSERLADPVAPSSELEDIRIEAHTFELPPERQRPQYDPPAEPIRFFEDLEGFEYVGIWDEGYVPSADTIVADNTSVAYGLAAEGFPVVHYSYDCGNNIEASVTHWGSLMQQYEPFWHNNPEVHPGYGTTPLAATGTVSAARPLIEHDIDDVNVLSSEFVRIRETGDVDAGAWLISSWLAPNEPQMETAVFVNAIFETNGDGRAELNPTFGDLTGDPADLFEHSEVVPYSYCLIEIWEQLGPFVAERDTTD